MSAAPTPTAAAVMGLLVVGTFMSSPIIARMQSDEFGPNPSLAAPDAQTIPTIDTAKAIGWKTGQKPTAARGLEVNAFASDLEHPRWLYRLPNGDVLVAESNAPPRPEDAPSTGIKGWIMGLAMKRAGAGMKSPNRIILLRDADGDGIAETRSSFREGLSSPFGMVLIGEDMYIANADALLRFRYRRDDLTLEGSGEKIVDLPAGINHHWTKNVVVNPDQTKLYISVGSNSNIGENGMEIEQDRAAIWEYDLASKTMRKFASGLRNPNGMDWEPTTGELWTAVNERDALGDTLVPDYITSVKDGAFYGWPYSYFGQHVDARVEPQRPEMVARAIAPDYALGAHTASLGIVFSDKSSLPNVWRHGLFVGQHGSWNRRPKSGYKVIYVPFKDGQPVGLPFDVLIGFLDSDNEHARGRPVGVTLGADGSLLVADDVGNAVWRVSAQSQ
jgi:glucose/arabinose dehydrogenase